jgi:hypothetical protein
MYTVRHFPGLALEHNELNSSGNGIVSDFIKCYIEKCVGSSHKAVLLPAAKARYKNCHFQGPAVCLNLQPIQSAQSICKLARYKYRPFAASEQCTQRITRGRILSTTESPSEEPAARRPVLVWSQQADHQDSKLPCASRIRENSPGRSYVGPDRLHRVQSHSQSSVLYTGNWRPPVCKPTNVQKLEIINFMI